MRNIFLLALLFLPFLRLPAYALDVGDVAPNFSLPASDGKNISLGDFRGKIVVLEWFNRGCPFVQKHYEIGAMQKLQREARENSVIWLTINSTNPEHRDFLGAEGAKRIIEEWKIQSFAMLTDAEGAVGLAYSAKTTPHLFVIGTDGKLAYQGAIDDDPSPSGTDAHTKSYVQAAIRDLLANRAVSTPEVKPYGCSVKYR